MIRLAAKMGAERKVEIRAPLADKLDVPPPLQAETDESDKDSFKSAISTTGVPYLIQDGREKVKKPVPLPPIEQPQPAENVSRKDKKKKARAKKAGKNGKEAEKRRFETKNIFDKLRELTVNPDAEGSSLNDDNNEDAEEDEGAAPPGFGNDGEGSGKWDDATEDTSSTWENQEYVQDKSGWVPIEQVKREAMELIPALEGESVFWKEFGNVLRVFGTEEGVLRIADWPGKE
jgi:poly(A)-specific ribonuclease